MLGVSQTSVKCTFSLDPFLPDFCLFALFSSTCIRKAKCVCGCGQSVLSLLQTAVAASFSGLVSLCQGTSKLLLHHKSTEGNQVTL